MRTPGAPRAATPSLGARVRVSFQTRRPAPSARAIHRHYGARYTVTSPPPSNDARRRRVAALPAPSRVLSAFRLRLHLLSLLLHRRAGPHRGGWFAAAKLPSFRCAAGPSAFASCAHPSGPTCCSYPRMSCMRFPCSSADRTYCQLAMAFIISTSPFTPPSGLSCTSRTKPPNACSFSVPSRSRRSAPHHGPTMSPKPPASCSGHRSANRPNAMAAFSPSDR